MLQQKRMMKNKIIYIRTYSDYETETEIGMVQNKDGVIYKEAVDLPEFVLDKQYKEIIVDKNSEEISE